MQMVELLADSVHGCARVRKFPGIGEHDRAVGIGRSDLGLELQESMQIAVVPQAIGQVVDLGLGYRRRIEGLIAHGVFQGVQDEVDLVAPLDIRREQVHDLSNFVGIGMRLFQGLKQTGGAVRHSGGSLLLLREELAQSGPILGDLGIVMCGRDLLAEQLLCIGTEDLPVLRLSDLLNLCEGIQNPGREVDIGHVRVVDVRIGKPGLRPDGDPHTALAH